MNQIVFSDGKKLRPSKIIGIGRNYVKHIEEMNSTPTEEPVIFLKPNSALHNILEPLIIPQNWGAVHHEVELAVCIGKMGRNIETESAGDYILGYGLALDLTLRDLQTKAKDAGLPWELAKGFDGACPVSQFVYKDAITNVDDLQLSLSVNHQVRQDSNTKFMLFKIPYLISYITRLITLLPGDLILTGTPAGVGALQTGDLIEARIKGIAHVKTKVS